VRLSRWARISSDEEERSREGYYVTTHYRFAPGSQTKRVDVVAADGSPLLEVLSAPQAELWRINHGWRRSPHRNGFAIDRATGRWRRREDDEIDPNEPPDPTMRTVMAGIKPFVTDSRNLLLLRSVTGTPVSEPFLRTLAYALQRGIQFVYQVEEQEVAVELIGRGDHQRLLLWEAAEGGTGVWERMLAGAGSFAEIAREALRICHCDPLTGAPDPAWDDRCAAACYDCLLSYSNQFDHRYIDRHLVREYLLQLTASTTAPASGQRSYAEQYRWLCERVDPASELERQLLDHL
jgi:hypothetical protein